MANFLDMGTPIKDTVNAFTPQSQSLWNGSKIANTPSFWDGLTKFGSKATNWMNKNSDAIGTIGGLAGGYMQYDMAQKQYDMQKQAFNYNKMLSEREKKRQEEAENAFALGFQNSSLGEV